MPSELGPKLQYDPVEAVDEHGNLITGTEEEMKEWMRRFNAEHERVIAEVTPLPDRSLLPDEDEEPIEEDFDGDDASDIDDYDDL